MYFPTIRWWAKNVLNRYFLKVLHLKIFLTHAFVKRLY
jgi:hypothetical protein